MIPFGDFAPDIADQNTSVATVANNVIPGANSYLPLSSLAEQSDALTGDCRGAVTMRDDSGNNYIFAGDATKLYSITSSVSDESKVGGYASNDESWSFVKWGNQVIASKMGDTPQVLSLGSSTFADLSGSPPQSRTMAVVRNFVVMGNTWDSTDGNKTNRVWWSGFEDETEWTVGTNQSDRQDIQGDGGEIRRIIGGEFGLVFQNRSIWRMSYVGTPLVFQFDEVEPSLGTVAGGSVVQVGSDVYFLAQDGFRVMRAGSVSESIGKNKIDIWFSGQLNASYQHKVSAAHSPKQGLIVWAYPSNASASGDLDSLIIYNYKAGRWSTADIDTQILMQGATAAYTLEQLDSFSSSLDALSLSLDHPAWKGGALQLAAFSSNNKLSFFSGAALSGTIETGALSNEYRMIRHISSRAIIDGGYTIALRTRDSLQDIESSGLTPSSPDASGKVNIRKTARYIRYKVVTSGDFNHAIGIESETQVAGKR